MNQSKPSQRGRASSKTDDGVEDDFQRPRLQQDPRRSTPSISRQRQHHRSGTGASSSAEVWDVRIIPPRGELCRLVTSVRLALAVRQNRRLTPVEGQNRRGFSLLRATTENLGLFDAKARWYLGDHTEDSTARFKRAQRCCVKEDSLSRHAVGYSPSRPSSAFRGGAGPVIQGGCPNALEPRRT